MEITNLPPEVLELICELCDDNIVYNVLPIVSRTFSIALQEDRGFWRRRCIKKDIDLTSKPPNKSWRYYFRCKLYHYNINISKANF